MVVLGGDPTLVSDVNDLEVALGDAPTPVAFSSSQLNSGAAGTTTTNMFTLAAATYRAGRAYELQLAGGYQVSTTTGYGFWTAWKGTIAGPALLEFGRLPVAGVVALMNLHFNRIFTVGATDITTAIQMGCQASSGATVTFIGSVLNPRFAMTRDVGPASAYPLMPVMP